MSDQNQQNQKPENPKRTKKRVWLAAIIIIIAVICCLLLWDLLKSKSVNEQLAAIEAARAIPDSQNAATIYSELLTERNASSFSFDFQDFETDNITARGPWLSRDHPELAQWIKERQDLVAKLLEASKKNECRFAITGFPERFGARIDRLSTMKQWARLLVRAANNDIAEDQIAAGIKKYICLVEMGRHLQQQPVMIDYLVGLAIEGLASGRIRSFIVEGPSAEIHLKAIEVGLPTTKNDWNNYSENMLKVEQLYARREPNFFLRMKYLWRNIEDSPEFNRIHEIYLRVLSDRRGSRILIALKRYKNKTGNWPQSLDEIKSSLRVEVLTDPRNNGAFVYKLTEDSFELYSIGKNNIDENGKYKRGPDDWPIWPPPGRKPKTEKEENANDK